MKELKDPVLPLLVSLLATSLAHGTPQLARREVCDDNKCYLLFAEALNFTSARDECSAESGDLATFPSADDQRKSLSLVNVTSGRFWIGLTLPADVRCPARDSDMYGFKWINGDAAKVSGWAGFPDRCDHRCVSVSTNGSWQQEPCGGTLDGFFCVAPVGCPAGERLAEPGVHNVSSGSTHARRLPPATEWTTRGEEEDSYFYSKWLCGFGVWYKAPWTCEVMNGGCAHTCLNNTCTCPAGQVLHANNVTCVDADECHDGKGCARENTQCQRKPGGGFKCVCQDGYDEEDGVCVDVSICAQCEHLLCDKVAGVYTCACRNGFIVSKVRPTRCDPYCDQKECPAKCEENPAKPGHHQCPCPDGYIHQIKNNASLCTEVDECANDNPCDHECVNTLGSYTCLCREGFVVYDEDECVPEVDDYRAATTSPVLHPPSSTAAGVPFYVRAGSVLGISVFVAVGVALLYLLLRYSLTHCRGTFEVTSLRRADMDVLTLQQVTTEKYQRFSFDKQSRADCQRL